MPRPVRPAARSQRASASEPQAAPRRFRAALPTALVLVAALVAAVHWPVLGARALSLDDGEFVTRNPLVTNPGWSSFGRFFGEVLNPSSVRGYYLPVPMTSLMLDAAAGGRHDHLTPFHRTSLALHVINTLLIVLLLHQLFGALVPAVLAGLLFGWHPLAVEPVAWLSQRKTLLASGFAFACLLAYVRHQRAGGRWWWRASIGLYALALMSKPSVATLPILLLVLDAWPLRRAFARAVAEKWPFVLLSLAASGIAVMSQVGTLGTTALPEAGITRMALQIGYLVIHYLRQFLWPRDLSSVHPPPDPIGLSHPAILTSVIATCVITIALVLASRRWRGPLAAWLFYLVALAPTFGVLVWSTFFTYDNYAYFPALGILLIVASGLAAAWQARASGGRWARVALLVPVIALLALEARGVRGTLRHWSDSLTLFRHMERVAPDAPAVQAQLGVLLQEAGEYDEALTHLRRAFELEPNQYPDAYFSLGMVLATRGEFEESGRYFRAADLRRPNDPVTIYNLGVALRLAGRLEDAEPRFRQVLRMQPDHLGSAIQLARVLIARGRSGEAAERLRAAIAIHPGSADLHHELAGALRRQGGPAGEARDHLRRAIELEPGWAQPFIDLAWDLATHPDDRDPAEALRLAERGTALSGGRDPAALDARAAAEAALGRFDQAARTEQQAIDLAAQANADSLLTGYRGRLLSYRRGVPHVEPRRR